MQFTVYLANCADGAYHSGITKDLSQRLAYHNDGNSALKATQLPLKIVFEQSFATVITAKEYHAELSNLAPESIPDLIAGKLLIEFNNAGDPETETTKPQLILPTSYLGNLAYFSKLAGKKLIIDSEELFKKQTYRSRCTILTSNGLQNLVVPVVRAKGVDTSAKNIKISYENDWQKNHIKTIESAYRKAPYYEYYGADLLAIIATDYEYLLDLNLALTQFLCNALKLDVGIILGGEEHHSEIAEKIASTPKSRTAFKGEVYHQIFKPTGNFENNLSVIDLLFNHGSWLA